MRLGCIGDDFTGSSDLGLILAEGGLATALYPGVPSGPAAADVDCGIVALKSRSIPVADAVALTLDAHAWLTAQGATQILFKYCSTFDSTPDGNIGPVIEALIRATGTTGPVIVCPAFPAAGRSVYQGHLFVADRLLSESGMQDHPITPMTDPDLRRWLARQTGAPVGWVSHAALAGGTGAEAMRRELDAGRQILVCDAIDEADLRTLGALAADHALVTGGSGIGLGLPANFGARPGEGTRWTGADGPAICLSGSCSATTRRQVAEHGRSGGPQFPLDADRVIAGRTTPEDAADWALAQDGLPLVYSSADPATVRAAQETHGGDRVAEAFERFFADTARIAVARGARRVVSAGGETSGAVVGALDLAAMTIGPKIATGVPALRAGDLALALKSGNFGEDDFFHDAARVLGGA